MRALSVLGLVGLVLGGSVDAVVIHPAKEAELVSDQSGVAARMDPNLLNPWGLAFDTTRGAMWITDNHSGGAAAYKADGTPLSLVVTIPAAGGSGTGAPTGVVFNGTTLFHGDRLVFVTEDGLVAGWTSGGAAVVEADESAAGTVYKGAAIARAKGGRRLYATDFHGGKVDVFDQDFHTVASPGSFADPQAPSGFAPFNVASIGGKLYVTYAKQDADQHDDVKGAGNGLIDVFDTDGKLVRRFASGTAAGGQLTVLDSPWGMALGRFGSSRKDLLVGNFGNGQIASFQPGKGKPRGTVDGTSGPLVIDGLWSIAFAPHGAAGSGKTLFFTAGPNGENDGLFGTLTSGRTK